MISIRYETPNHSFFTRPFVLGVRHFQVAFSSGSQEALLELARERVILRPFEANDNRYPPLNLMQRVSHFVLGFIETLGYVLCLVVPFLAAYGFDRPTVTIMGGPEGYATHIKEGGSLALSSQLRRNPFEKDGKEDPFYAGASWLKKI